MQETEDKEEYNFKKDPDRVLIRGMIWGIVLASFLMVLVTTITVLIKGIQGGFW